MKPFILSTIAIIFSFHPAFASTSMKCQLETQVGEDGADRPIMKVLTSETQTVSPEQNITLKSAEVEGASFFVQIWNGELVVKIHDKQDGRTMYSKVDGVDIKRPRLNITSNLSTDAYPQGARILVLQCLGN